MADNAEIHGKILTLLMSEWPRTGTRQLTQVDLVYSPGNGYRDEEIRSWVRADQPDMFADFVNIEKLVSEILDIAVTEVEAKTAGKHRFVVRCRQHAGARPSTSFALSPSFTGDEGALVTSTPVAGGSRGDGVAVAQVLTSNNTALMRINQQMFDGTIRVLGQQTMNLHQQVTDLTAENANLRRELEEARSNKMDREFQLAMAAEKNARTNAGFQKLLQMGTVVMAKFAPGAGGQSATETALGMLVSEWANSLRQDQGMAIVQLLDVSQKMLFLDIMNAVRPPETNGTSAEPPNGEAAAPPPV